MVQSLVKKSINSKLFKVISECADESGLECYVIGGFVRDLFLGLKKSKDIDILVIGDGIDIAKKVSDKLRCKSKISVYKNFRTAAFKHENFELEFVGSRKESYNINSRNPKVEIGTLDNDLDRRDFTINTI
jgi:poly(A) polymerase